MRTCSIEGCKNVHYAHGVCNKHYLSKRYANGYRPPPQVIDREAARLRASEWWDEFGEEANAKRRTKYAEDSTSVKDRNKVWRKENYDKEKEKIRSSEYRKNNPEKRKETIAKSRRKNSANVNAITVLRRAKKLQATPNWADELAMKEIYKIAAIYKKETGINFHVDHIVPLRSKLVCGFHCPANLQIIPAIENYSKNNRHWPDMPI